MNHQLERVRSVKHELSLDVHSSLWHNYGIADEDLSPLHRDSIASSGCAVDGFHEGLDLEAQRG
jgi:hypothetical protein